MERRSTLPEQFLPNHRIVATRDTRSRIDLNPLRPRAASRPVSPRAKFIRWPQHNGGQRDHRRAINHLKRGHGDEQVEDFPLGSDRPSGDVKPETKRCRGRDPGVDRSKPSINFRAGGAHCWDQAIACRRQDHPAKGERHRGVERASEASGLRRGEKGEPGQKIRGGECRDFGENHMTESEAAEFTDQQNNRKARQHKHRHPTKPRGRLADHDLGGCQVGREDVVKRFPLDFAGNRARGESGSQTQDRDALHHDQNVEKQSSKPSGDRGMNLRLTPQRGLIKRPQHGQERQPIKRSPRVARESARIGRHLHPENGAGQHARGDSLGADMANSLYERTRRPGPFCFGERGA